MEKPHQNSSASPRFNSAPIILVGSGLLSGLIYFFNFRLHRFFTPFAATGNAGIHFYVFIFLILSVLYMISVYLLLKQRLLGVQPKSMLLIVLILAVIFRACLLPADPAVLSKDMYRYIWDARVQQNGINPYRHPPDADELKELRDDKIYPSINRKSYPTLYPAGAQIFFRLFGMIVGDSVTGYKSLMTLFDVLTLFVLLGLLRVYGFDDIRLIVYAWHPLVIFEIAYSGHLEGLTVFWMVLALYLNATHKPMLAVASLAISSAIKLYPALLLPALLNPGERLRGILTFAVAIVLLYLPFFDAGRKVLGFLAIYLQNPNESFNLGLKYLMIQLLPQLDYYLLSKIFLLGLVAAGSIIFFKNKQSKPAIRYAYLLIGLLIVMMPASLHPWYVIILIPLLCIYPAVAWLVFSCTVTLSYLKYVTPSGVMPTWVLVLEYGLLMILLAGGYILKRYSSKNANIAGPHRYERKYFLESHL